MGNDQKIKVVKLKVAMPKPKYQLNTHIVHVTRPPVWATNNPICHLNGYIRVRI